MTGAGRGANDPQRRERILDAAIEVIADHGVQRTTHRRIADAAGVPLGSVTYYFDGLADLLAQAFQRFSERKASLYRDSLERAVDRRAACEAVAELICGIDYVGSREMVVIWEMHAHANHDERVAEINLAWLRRSHESLALHFSPAACRAIDALVEGWSMHQQFERRPLDRAVVVATIEAVADRLR